MLIVLASKDTSVNTCIYFLLGTHTADMKRTLESKIHINYDSKNQNLYNNIFPFFLVYFFYLVVAHPFQSSCLSYQFVTFPLSDSKISTDESLGRSRGGGSILILTRFMYAKPRFLSTCAYVNGRYMCERYIQT